MSAKKEIWEECSALIRRSREGEPRAYERFLRLVTGVLRSYLIPRIGNEEDREDLIQEILIGLHKARDSYRSEKHPAPWVFAIARYKTIDFLRKKKTGDKTYTTDLLENFPSPEPEVDREEPERVREILREWLTVLDERQKLIFTHVKLDGMSVREVSERTGLSESNIKVITHRAVQKIRKHFSPDH
ncbi:sigma-70 family RNA polymerase sigma factor [Leptospira ellisii]|uniref:RNA polymerase subunit sigma-70 n=1 Tax=Leptospira ellisii TaxID=2023197 RepID=A0A2N0BKD6_9LEPT|nr:sigma-70 family RNA polymerase sigma factor [Leptospira ellisii]MDV6234980.1 sigma-70 family RNA polymerase sigma factor [Leptospira ellisii]PJZ93072.1 RNA polymerase subunit sigma-70 [Leptospira ellisii]PKA04479.1 RNA polymerase subunit sigma-70 [Leptospira ellisii]